MSQTETRREMNAAQRVLEERLEQVGEEIRKAHRESLLLTQQLRASEASFEAAVEEQRELHEALTVLESDTRRREG